MDSCQYSGLSLRTYKCCHYLKEQSGPAGSKTKSKICRGYNARRDTPTHYAREEAQVTRFTIFGADVEGVRSSGAQVEIRGVWVNDDALLYWGES